MIDIGCVEIRKDRWMMLGGGGGGVGGFPIVGAMSETLFGACNVLNGSDCGVGFLGRTFFSRVRKRSLQVCLLLKCNLGGGGGSSSTGDATKWPMMNNGQQNSRETKFELCTKGKLEILWTCGCCPLADSIVCTDAIF